MSSDKNSASSLTLIGPRNKQSTILSRSGSANVRSLAAHSSNSFFVFITLSAFAPGVTPFKSSSPLMQWVFADSRYLSEVRLGVPRQAPCGHRVVAGRTAIRQCVAFVLGAVSDLRDGRIEHYFSARSLQWYVRNFPIVQQDQPTLIDQAKPHS